MHCWCSSGSMRCAYACQYEWQASRSRKQMVQQTPLHMLIWVHCCVWLKLVGGAISYMHQLGFACEKRCKSLRVRLQDTLGTLGFIAHGSIHRSSWSIWSHVLLLIRQVHPSQGALSWHLHGAPWHGVHHRPSSSCAHSPLLESKHQMHIQPCYCGHAFRVQHKVQRASLLTWPFLSLCLLAGQLTLTKPASSSSTPT